MIRYLSDYNRFVVHHDYTTKNTSFLEMAALLKKAGVKNNKFMLQIFQKDLIGVDPHDPNLPVTIKAKISLEMTHNFWYFLREVVRLPAGSIDGGMPFILNRGCMAFMWLFLNSIDVAVVMPRQTGKTTGMELLLIWIMWFNGKGSRAGLLTKDSGLREKTIESIKEKMVLLPRWSIRKDKADPDNKSELAAKHPRLDNSLITAVAQADKEAAYRIFRGNRLNLRLFDEMAFTKNVHISYSAIQQTGNKADEIAKMGNQIHGSFHATTAERLSVTEAKFTYDLFHNGSPWSELFYDVNNREELVTAIRSNLKHSMAKTLVNCTFSHRQLNFSDEWMLEKIINSQGSQGVIDVELFNVWAAGGGTSPFTKAMLSKLTASAKDPVFTEFAINRVVFRWYVSEDDRDRIFNMEPVILAMDLSEGIGRDSVAGVYFRPYTMEVLGVFATSRINLDILTNWLVEHMIDNPRLIYMPERKSSAQGIIDAMLVRLPVHGINPFKRIYNTINNDREKNYRQWDEINSPSAYRDSNVLEKYKEMFGYVTTATTRAALYDNTIKYALDNSADRVYDRGLIDEIKGLREEDGRLDHDSTAHDDMIIAWLLAYWMTRSGKNLGYYGIDSRIINEFIRELRRPVNVDPVKAAAADREDRFKKEALSILEEVVKTRDKVRIAYLDNRLRQISSQINLEQLFAIEGGNYDGYIEKIKEMKRMNSITKRMNVTPIGAARMTSSIQSQLHGMRRAA